MSEPKWTKGPWRYCGTGAVETMAGVPRGMRSTLKDKGGCICGQVWAIPGDHPVATAVLGEWGDEYPALRLDPESGDTKAEAYMATMIYGSISEETGKANARLISAAPELYDALYETATFLSAFVREDSDAIAAVVLGMARAALAKARGD